MTTSLRRGHTAAQKARAIIAAEMTNPASAAAAMGLAERTVYDWVNDPDYQVLRLRARELVADDAIVLAQMATAEIRRKLPTFEPRDLTVLYGVLIDKAQLLSGQATARTETRTLTESLDDHEREALRKIIDEVLAAAEAAQ